MVTCRTTNVKKKYREASHRRNNTTMILKEAEIVAAHPVQANLLGHDSHGVGMIPIYVSNLSDGTLIANQQTGGG
jgi:LDH2 family malate/lactate/ureidoglycolate dehydrogenase